MKEIFQIYQPLAIGDHNVLRGDYPKVLDFQNLNLTYQGIIRLSDSELVEVIHLPAFTFIDVEIENLPNLTEIHAAEDGPTWLVCRNLPKLKTIIVDGSVRWFCVDGAEQLQTIDIGKCEHLGYLSLSNVPSLNSINVDRCRLLQQIDDMDAEHQIQLGVTRQLLALQSRSKLDSSLYEGMTFTDIDLVLANISRGEVLLKKKLSEFNNMSGRLDTMHSDYSYRLLEPGESVYTGGTGESYCYAFEVSSHDASQPLGVTSIDYEVGIHEPEDAIANALSWVAAGLVVSRDSTPSNDQVLSFINVLLNEPNAALPAWAYSEQP